MSARFTEVMMFCLRCVSLQVSVASYHAVSLAGSWLRFSLIPYVFLMRYVCLSYAFLYSSLLCLMNDICTAGKIEYHLCVVIKFNF